MIKTRGWKAAVAVLGAVVLLTGSAYWLLAERPSEYETVPDVSVQLMDGRVVSMPSLEGQVVLLNFWATWCPPCRLEMPGFQRVWEARRDDGFTIVGLSTDIISDDQIAWFLEQRGIEYPVGRATRWVADAFGGARTLPTSYLIDADGRIRKQVTGAYDEAELVSDVDALLREAGREPTGEVEIARRGAPSWMDLKDVGHVMGDASAPVTVVEFSDYGCAYCSRFAQQTFPALYQGYIEPGRVRWVHVPFVLGKFANSEEAAVAAACAAEQGDAAFWATHLTLFRRQPEWREAQDAAAVFAGYVEAAGGDARAFSTCYAEDRPRGSLIRAEEVAMAAGVSATPTFFVNGQRVEGAVPLQEFRRILDQAGR